jgi:hypothetical protein
MSVKSTELPSRFPVGTRYVVEGKPDKKGIFRVTSRCLIFPDGRELHLPAAIKRGTPRAAATRLKMQARRLRTRKKS